MKMSIVGYGNLGQFFAERLTASGWCVNIVRARELSDPITLAEPVLICVPENEIPSISERLINPDIVLHSSGSIGPDVLRPHRCIGVMHPIMTFHRERPYPSSYPVTFEGDSRAYDFASKIALSTGGQLIPFRGDRVQYHASAVIAGNLSTILINAAVKLLLDNGYSIYEATALLKPLALASIENVDSINLRDHLTGPIARSQTDVIQAQQRSLNDYDHSLAELYKQIIDFGIKKFNETDY